MEDESYRSKEDHYESQPQNGVSHSEDYPNGQKTNRNNNSYVSQSHDYVKKVFVHRNGDAFNGPRKIVWNKKQMRNMDCFLENLTNVLKPRNGMIREIHTPQTGTRIHDFEELEPYRTYVAVANGERLQKIDYLNLMQQNERKQRRNILNSGTNSEPPRISGVEILPPLVHPVVHSRIQVSGRIKHELQKRGKTIYIFKNGDEYSRPITVLLKPNFQNDMDLIFKSIEERVVLPFNKPLRRMYTMNGERVTNPDNLEEKQYYVAAAAEPFLPKIYGQDLPTVIVGRFDRNERIKYLSMMPTPMQGKSRFEDPKSHRTNGGGKTFRANDQGPIQEDENEGLPETSRREYQKKVLRWYRVRLRTKRNLAPSRKNIGYSDSRLSRQPQEGDVANHSRSTKQPTNGSQHKEASKSRLSRPQEKEIRATTRVKKSHNRSLEEEDPPAKPTESDYHWNYTRAVDNAYSQNNSHAHSNEDFDQDDGGVFKSKESPIKEPLQPVIEDKDTRVDLPYEMKRPETVDLEEIPNEDIKPPRKNQSTMTDILITIEKSQQPEYNRIIADTEHEMLLKPIKLDLTKTQL